MIERQEWLKRAKYLAYFTVLYNLVEGIAAITFGVKEESISLAGFGGDSLIEVGSAVLVLWKLRADTDQTQSVRLQKERHATFGIGLLFLILGVIVVGASVIQLLEKSPPDTTIPGIVISLLSLSFMFWLWKAKRLVATALDSKTVMSDARCSLACIKLSLILFVGSLLCLLFPALWWVDVFAAIVLAFFVTKEGLQMIQAAKRPEFTGGCCD